jgi:DNA-damage-inducible protein J
MTTTSMLHIRMDDKTKSEAMAVLEALGLTAADAVRLLFHRIVADQAFPLELKVLNAETRAAMAEAEEIVAVWRAGFADAGALIARVDAKR